MKKLIVLATLAALPAVAMADVVITGDLGVAINNVKNKDEGVNTSANNMSRQTGQIIFKGTEDLGNGLKSIFQIANRVDASGNEASNTFGRRDTFVGLAGDFGTVRIGRLSTTANSGYTAAEPFEQIMIGGDAVIRNVAEARTNNTIRYDSPTIAGFSGALAVELRPEAVSPTASSAYVIDQDKTSPTYGQNILKTTAPNNGAAHTTSLGLKYVAGPVTATYSRVQMQDKFLGSAKALGGGSDVVAQGAKTNTDQFALVYAADALNVGFNYAGVKAKTADAGKTYKESGYGVYASYAVGQFTPVVSFYKEGKQTIDGKDTLGSYNVVSLGTNYALSKRTSAGVELQFQGGRENIAKGDGSKSGKTNTTSVYLTTSF